MANKAKWVALTHQRFHWLIKLAFKLSNPSLFFTAAAA